MSEHDHVHDEVHERATDAGEAQEPPAGPVAGAVAGAGPAGEVDAPESTGDDRVDAAVSRLAELDGSPVHEHAAVVEAIHRTLQDTLAEDEG